MGLGSVLKHANSALGATAGNVAKQNTNGSKGSKIEFIANTIKGSLNRVTYVSTIERQTISQSGIIIGSGIETDIALSGLGMIPVRSNPKDPNSEILFTREGSFRKTVNGNYVNIGGMSMIGWKLDSNGNPPINSSLLGSLQDINLRNTNIDPVATSLVSFNMNLQASQQALKGAGEVMQVNRSGFNANITDDNIIVPENMMNSSLKQGDRITLTSTPPNSPKTFEYGGISVSKQITSSGGFYGSRSISGNFTVVAGAAQTNQISAGTGIKIILDGNETIITASQNPNSAVGQNQFNSFDSLRASINNIPGLVANIRGDRLYVASTQGNAKIEFQNYSGTNMVETLGLTNIAAADPGIERFATLKTLKDKINTNNVVNGLKAESGSVTGSLDIHTLLATSGFSINGTSFGVNKFSYVSTNGSTYTAADGGIVRGAASINITSPNHGLTVGDLVNVTGISGIAGGSDGHFMVSNIISNDVFTVNCADVSTNFTLATNNNLAPVNGTWQKIAGQTFIKRDLTASTIIGTASFSKLQITDIGTSATGHGLQDNDVIYISGIGARLIGGRYFEVPDGYYSVTTGGSNQNFTITPTNSSGTIPPGTALVGNFSYRKIGTRADANIQNDIHFDNTVLNTVGATGDKTVKMYISNNNYNINDYVKLSGLSPLNPNNQFVFNGLNLKNDFAYKITDRDKDSITLNLLDDPNSGGINLTDGSDNTKASYTATPGAGGTNLGPTFNVNDYSRTFSYFNFLQDQFDFNATYNASSVDKSLSTITENSLLKSLVFDYAFNVIDSLGISHQLILKAAKLDTNKWTVEISAIKNSATDEFDIITDDNTGRIADGEILFDDSGNLVTVGKLATPINIRWKGGSSVSSITLDFAGTSGDVNGIRGNITQNDGLSDMHGLEQNGITAGIIEDISIDSQGYVIGRFDNGEFKKLYQIPVATFVNLDGLEPEQSNSFKTTIKSGKAVLKVAGTRGAASITSKAVEASNIDGIGELIDIQQLSNFYQVNGRATATLLKNIQILLNEINLH